MTPFLVYSVYSFNDKNIDRILFLSWYFYKLVLTRQNIEQLYLDFWLSLKVVFSIDHLSKLVKIHVRYLVSLFDWMRSSKLGKDFEIVVKIFWLWYKTIRI